MDTTVTAEQIRSAALDRYGHEQGAPEDIAAGTPVILVDYASGRSGAGRGVHVLYGPAVRLTDGTYLRAAEAVEAFGVTLTGRAAIDDTAEKAARRAVGRRLAGAVVPVEYSRSR